MSKDDRKIGITMECITFNAPFIEPAFWFHGIPVTSKANKIEISKVTLIDMGYNPDYVYHYQIEHHEEYANTLSTRILATTVFCKYCPNQMTLEDSTRKTPDINVIARILVQLQNMASSSAIVLPNRKPRFADKRPTVIKKYIYIYLDIQ